MRDTDIDIISIELKDGMIQIKKRESGNETPDTIPLIKLPFIIDTDSCGDSHCKIPYIPPSKPSIVQQLKLSNISPSKLPNTSPSKLRKPSILKKPKYKNNHGTIFKYACLFLLLAHVSYFTLSISLDSPQNTQKNSIKKPFPELVLKKYGYNNKHHRKPHPLRLTDKISPNDITRPIIITGVGFLIGIPYVPGIIDNIAVGVVSGIIATYGTNCTKNTLINSLSNLKCAINDLAHNITRKYSEGFKK